MNMNKLNIILGLALSYLVKCQDENGEPTLRIMARTTVYNVNETKAIFCKGENLQEPINWFSPSGKLVEERSHKNNRVFVERKETEAAILVPLIIQSVKITDGGNWTCKSGNLSETREFIVGQKVNLPDRNVSIEGEELKNVRLTCDAKGYPTPVVTWYKDKVPIDKEDVKKYVIKPDNSLEIKKLNHADVGLYVCKVRQKALSHYTEKTVQLSVQHKPIMYDRDTQKVYESERFRTEEAYAILNETKKIPCSAIANPPPVYKWYRRLKNGYDELITDPGWMMTSEDATSSELILRMYDESYVGQYKCSATNNKGTVSILFDVNLAAKPDQPDFVEVASLNVTEITLNISCSTCNYPKPEDEIVPTNPKNLTIIGFSVQLAEEVKGYPVDWDAGVTYDVKIESNDTLFTVGPLRNNTEYHVRVSTINAAGNSDWFEMEGTATTLALAVKPAATVLLIVAALVFTLF